MPILTHPAMPSGGLAGRDQPVLKVDDFVLRPWRAQDAPAVAAAYSEPAIQHWHARSMDEDEARTWIGSWPGRWAEESGAGWAMADESGVLGQISVRRLNLMDGLGEVSYWVLPAARGRRIATRALCTLSEWVFDELGLHRFELAHSTLNAASCGVADKAGFAYEGTKRSEMLHADGWHDMHLHARLSGDPRPDVLAPR